MVPPLCCYLLLLISSIHEVIRMVNDDIHGILFSCYNSEEHFPINLVFTKYTLNKKNVGPFTTFQNKNLPQIPRGEL